MKKKYISPKTALLEAECTLPLAASLVKDNPSVGLDTGTSSPGYGGNSSGTLIVGAKGNSVWEAWDE